MDMVDVNLTNDLRDCHVTNNWQNKSTLLHEKCLLLVWHIHHPSCPPLVDSQAINTIHQLLWPQDIASGGFTLLLVESLVHHIHSLKGASMHRHPMHLTSGGTWQVGSEKGLGSKRGSTNRLFQTDALKGKKGKSGHRRDGEYVILFKNVKNNAHFQTVSLGTQNTIGLENWTAK